MDFFSYFLKGLSLPRADRFQNVALAFSTGVRRSAKLRDIKTVQLSEREEKAASEKETLACCACDDVNTDPNVLFSLLIFLFAAQMCVTFIATIFD